MLRVYRGYVAITWLQSASKERMEDRGVRPAGGKNYSHWRLEGNKIRHRERSSSVIKGSWRSESGVRSPGIIIARATGFETDYNVIFDNALIRRDLYSVGAFNITVGDHGNYRL